MIPRVRFANLPTPIEAMPRLSAALNGPKLWVKRDDLTGLAFGGNKTRKLELLIAEAQANMARTLVTTGAVQSNHCRQTAAVAARFGLDCILVLTGDPASRSSGNLLLDRFFGAEIVWCDPAEQESAFQQTFQKAWDDGRRPYLVPYGGSSPVGAAAYALAFDEFLEQGVEVDWIVFATSSGGTQAGLVAGARRASWPGKILGISVAEPAAPIRERVARLAGEVSDRLGKALTFDPAEIHVDDHYLGQGYAAMGAPEREAIELFARQEGLLVDPVYTGRAAAGMIDLIRQGFFQATDRVLFWHTGGTPALFAEPYTAEYGI